jgi:flagellar biosynthesis protein FliR
MDLTPVALFGLLLVRPGMIVALAPAFGGSFLPARAKVALTVVIAVALVPSVSIPPPTGDLALTLVIMREAAIGMALAFMMRALIAGTELAGHLASQQIGFSYAGIIDPSTGVQNNAVSWLYGMVATMAFLGLNGHHDVLRALAASYSGLPIGAGHVDAALLTGVREALGLVFVVGVRLAAPIVLVLLVVELAVGLISRTAPSLNFMIIGFPLRLIVGLIVLGIIVAAVPQVTGSLIERTIAMSGRLDAAFR